MYARRAALQQAIGEAAGGSADIEADAARDVDAEMRDGGIQLESAAADEGRLREEFDAGFGVHRLAGFRGLAPVDAEPRPP